MCCVRRARQGWSNQRATPWLESRRWLLAACSARAPLAAASNPSSCLPLSPGPRCALCGADPAARPLESSSVQPLLAGRVPLLCVPAAPGPLPAQHLSPCVVLSSPHDCGRDVCPPASGAERASADVR